MDELTPAASPPAFSLDELAEILSSVERPGDFYASGQRAAPIPRLDVEGVGTLSFPLPASQAEQLIAVAERAPYGRGDQTLVDTAVRRAWQIPPSRIRLADSRWQETLAALVDEMAAGLGVTGTVEAQLYKLLVYDQGSFFVDHRDTEKVDGMFATLVVVLPSTYQGGELVVRHAGREVTLELPGEEPSQVSYAAFYADCVHELRPVVSGCRLALVYNLVRKGKGKAPTPPDYRREQDRVVDFFLRWSKAEDSPIKAVFVLEHHYTPAELGFSALKGVDAAAAAVLEKAAREAGCALYLAMVSIQESGSAEHTGYGRRGRWSYDDEDEDEFEVYEVLDRSQMLTDWRTVDDEPAPFGATPYEDDELCPSDALEDEEPDEQHFMEATGNEGASFERTYRRAALVLWPRDRTLEVLNQAGLQTTLPYLGALVERWHANGPVAEAETWREAHTLAGHMIATWRRVSRGAWFPQGDQRSATFLGLLVTLRDAPNVLRFFSEVLAAGGYTGSEDEAIAAGVALVGWNNAAERLRQVALRNMHTAPGTVVGLLARLSGMTWKGPWGVQGPRALADAVVSSLPGAPPSLELPQWHGVPKPDAALVRALLTALAQLGDEPLGARAAGHVLGHPALYPLDEVLLPALLELVDTPAPRSPAFERLREVAVAHLNARVAEPLEAPRDWSRAAELGCSCADCRAAASFLADPALQRWTLKAIENRRRHVEERLRAKPHDVDLSTERRGSPHTLVVTKNQRSYDQRVAQRDRDLAALPRLARPMEGA